MPGINGLGGKCCCVPCITCALAETSTALPATNYVATLFSTSCHSGTVTLERYSKRLEAWSSTNSLICRVSKHNIHWAGGPLMCAGGDINPNSYLVLFCPRGPQGGTGGLLGTCLITGVPVKAHAAIVENYTQRTADIASFSFTYSDGHSWNVKNDSAQVTEYSCGPADWETSIPSHNATIVITE
jgi:hypothetical protein